MAEDHIKTGAVLGFQMSQPFGISVASRAGWCGGKLARGFTLIELVVAISVLGILTVIALPSYRTLSQNSRRASSSNDFVVALSYARAQAMEQHVTVSVCRSSNATTASPTCDSGAAGTGWESGWIVFTDATGNGIYDSASDTLLRQHGPLYTGTAANPSITLRGNSGATGTKDVIVFSRYGSSNNGGALAICDSRGWGTNSRVLLVSTGGRVQAVDQAKQTAVNTCTPS